MSKVTGLMSSMRNKTSKAKAAAAKKAGSLRRSHLSSDSGSMSEVPDLCCEQTHVQSRLMMKEARKASCLHSVAQ